jgi:hypothetical protein
LEAIVRGGRTDTTLFIYRHFSRFFLARLLTSAECGFGLIGGRDEFAGALPPAARLTGLLSFKMIAIRVRTSRRVAIDDGHDA